MLNTNTQEGQELMLQRLGVGASVNPAAAERFRAAISFDENSTSLIASYTPTGIDARDGQNIDEWISEINGRNLIQPNSSKIPKFLGGGARFDGVDDLISYNSHPEFIEGINLPDASGGDPGEGFTCTGLTYDPSTNTWWVGNDGRNVESDLTFAPSLVNLSFDFLTKIGEILLAPLYPSMQSLQGVAFDTSDGTLWCASPQEAQIKHLTTAGVAIDAINCASSGKEVNGIAYDSGEDCLYVLYNTGLLRKYSCSTRAQIGADLYDFANTSSDQLFWDVRKRLLYATFGINGSVGNITAYDPNSGVRYDNYPMSASDSVEGIVILNGILYSTNDGYFHVGTPPKNRIIKYKWSGIDFPGSNITGFTAVFSGNLTSGIAAQTRTIWSVGEPLARNGISLSAVGNTANDVRLSVNTGRSGAAQLDVLNITLTVPRINRSTISIRVDLVARTFEIRQNSVQLAQGALTNTATSMLFRPTITIGNQPDYYVGTSRACPLQAMGAAFYSKSLSDAELLTVENKFSEI